MTHVTSARRRTPHLMLGLAALCALGWACAAPARSAPARDWPFYSRTDQAERNGPHEHIEANETVRALQYLLCARGYPVVTDGFLGKSTDAAVRRFQRAHHLTADGRTTPPFWEALVIRIVPGSKGPAVRAAQVLLREAGYGVRADGRFGPRMQAAVRKFQGRTGHTPDSVIGLNTWAELMMVDNYGD